jgi:hypothetical protein
MKQVTCGLCLAVAVSAWATPPEVANVRASQRADTKLVDIYYDAMDADGDLLKIRLGDEIVQALLRVIALGKPAAEVHALLKTELF